MSEEMDSELQAIATLIATLQPLESDARTRVINYVFEKLGITPARPAQSILSHVGMADDVHEVNPQVAPVIAAMAAAPVSATDIRSLRDSKKPATATEMVAIVAYYLAHLARAGERSDTIGTEEIKKYFIEANYPLPKATAQTLVNAKNAGYLEARGSGRYALNAVGHNLVAHKLPASREPAPKRKTKPKPKSRR